ncbi:hypothetical protein [Paenibacillus sp. NPDC057967]|uniref:hypothetical protein n=1 Tax=Paenibacillus sp. NPDC057967 TaxID=3346293 RepID=UPI0036DE6FF6
MQQAESCGMVRRSRMPDLKLAWERNGGTALSPAYGEGSHYSVTAGRRHSAPSGQLSTNACSIHPMQAAFRSDAAK